MQRRSFSRSSRFISFFFVFITIGLLVLFLLPLDSTAQGNRLISTNDWRYEYIKRLQQRGYLLQLNPADLPYNYRDVRQALQGVDPDRLGRHEKRWYNLLDRNFKKGRTNLEEVHLGGLFAAGVRHSSSDRLNVDNPLGDGKFLLPRAQLMGYMEWKRWIGQAGLTFDWFYDGDPDGLDTVRRLYSRSEEVYFGYSGDMLEAYVGRFTNHWSAYGRQGAFLTDNPRSFDQLQLKFGTSTISFSSIFGELDNIYPDGTHNEVFFEPGGIRRYLFLHRLDWSPVSQLKIAFMEGEIYHSETAGISIGNLVPLHFLFFDHISAPINDDTNIIVGGSVWYQTGLFTLFLQGMLDDLEIENRQERIVNNVFKPISYAINGSITYSVNSFELGLESDWVSSNAYRSSEFADQWTYAQRGLATNFSDYIRNKVYTTFYPVGLRGLQIEPAITFYLKGQADLRDLRTALNPDSSRIERILSGTVERTIRPSLYLRYQPLNVKAFGTNRINIWFDADIGFNFVDNAGHVENATDRCFIGLFRLFGQMEF